MGAVARVGQLTNGVSFAQTGGLGGAHPQQLWSGQALDRRRCEATSQPEFLSRRLGAGGHPTEILECYAPVFKGAACITRDAGRGVAGE